MATTLTANSYPPNTCAVYVIIRWTPAKAWLCLLDLFEIGLCSKSTWFATATWPCDESKMAFPSNAMASQKPTESVAKNTCSEMQNGVNRSVCSCSVQLILCRHNLHSCQNKTTTHCSIVQLICSRANWMPVCRWDSINFESYSDLWAIKIPSARCHRLICIPRNVCKFRTSWDAFRCRFLNHVEM